MSESDKIKTFFKRALGVVSTFKDTTWYDEINGRQRNIVEAKDINIEKTPELPEWSDSSLNSSTMATLGFDLDSDDFASSSSIFTDLHLYSSSPDTYTDVGERLPGMYLDESVSDSSGVVALFVRLKLDKMEGDENLDPSAIAYVKIRRNEEKISSPSVKWGGSYLSLIDTTTQITFSSNGGDLGKYTDTLSRYIDFSTAVAIFEINTADSNNVILEQETEVFLIKRSTGWSDVSTDGWTLIDTDNASIGYFIQGVSSSDMQLFRRVYQAGTYYFDNNSALYIFQRLYTTSIMDNAYEFSYKTKTNVGSSIYVFKPYNYTLEYSDDDSNFYTVANNIGNWTFDTNSGTILFEHDPSLNDDTIDLSNGDLYFTFTKYVGLQGLENLMHYKNGKIGIGNKDPQYELDISGSVRIGGDLDIEKNLTVGTSTLFIDSTTSYIGINKTDPTTALDVSGDVSIIGSLTTTGVGTGPGFAPIGSIIMWPTIYGPDLSYGKWVLCHGDKTNYSKTEYPGLRGLNLSENNGFWELPDYMSYYIRGADYTTSADTIDTDGSNNINFDVSLNNLPFHNHNIPEHSHNILDSGHNHSYPIHNHTIDDNDSDLSHSHSINSHQHTITAKNHSHGIADATHNHNLATNVTGNHNHSYNGGSHAANHTFSASHTHQYQKRTINSGNTGRGEDDKQRNAFKDLDIVYNTAETTDANWDITFSNVSHTTVNVVGNFINDVGGSGNFNSGSGSLGFNDTYNSTPVIQDASFSVTISAATTVNNTAGARGDANNSGSSSLSLDDSNITSTGITLNDNAEHLQNTISKSIEPIYHTIFFFIRVA